MGSTQSVASAGVRVPPPSSAKGFRHIAGPKRRKGRRPHDRSEERERVPRYTLGASLNSKPASRDAFFCRAQLPSHALHLSLSLFLPSLPHLPSPYNSCAQLSICQARASISHRRLLRIDHHYPPPPTPSFALADHSISFSLFYSSPFALFSWFFLSFFLSTTTTTLFLSSGLWRRGFVLTQLPSVFASRSGKTRTRRSSCRRRNNIHIHPSREKKERERER